MTQTNEVLTLQDERDIAAVIVCYGTGIDTRDWVLFSTCFTDDLVAEYGDFGTWHGSDEITAVMEKMHEPIGPTLHRMSNIVISAIPGGAKVRTYVDALLTPKEADGVVHQGIGFYDDELIKTNVGWKIKKRRFNAVRIT